jgi:hypothetical protein
MTDQQLPKDRPSIYQIRINGHLDQRWEAWFEDVTITLADNGETILTCEVVDQAALHALLTKVRNLGLPLLSVNRISSDEEDSTNT